MHIFLLDLNFVKMLNLWYITPPNVFFKTLVVWWPHVFKCDLYTTWFDHLG